MLRVVESMRRKALCLLTPYELQLTALRLTVLPTSRLGYERESAGASAGLRTPMLASLGSSNFYSGSLTPFRGMPAWAQALGEVLPLTHLLRIVRGILLKGNGVAEIGPDLWPIGAFMLGAGVIALARYRQTLD